MLESLLVVNTEVAPHPRVYREGKVTGEGGPVCRGLVSLTACPANPELIEKYVACYSPDVSHPVSELHILLNAVYSLLSRKKNVNFLTPCHA